MILGFTGTQRGITINQSDRLLYWLEKLWPWDEFHHGDCIGADAQANELILAHFPSSSLNIHPPINPSKRAYCSGALIHPPKEYLPRNKDIVVVSNVMFACPSGDTEQLRSGTWSTVRFSRKISRALCTIFPSGDDSWSNVGPELAHRIYDK
jgi:hypothetical protein